MNQLPQKELLNVGLRFKSARSLVALTRKEFCAKHELNPHMVQAWEIGRNASRGKNLARFCDALAREGVLCAPEWLLHGTGKSPYKINGSEQLVAHDNDFPSSDEGGLIDSEAQFFRETYAKHGRKPIVVRIADNAMQPLFRQGDYVGGFLQTNGTLDSLAGEICIVEIGAQNFIVRRLVKEGHRFLLLGQDFKEPVISFESVVGAAEIIWHRRIAKK
jgi:SOS-response transcriptional repressor LexA